MVTEAETAPSLATGAPLPRTELELDQTVPAEVESKSPVSASKAARSGNRQSSSSEGVPNTENDCRLGHHPA